MRNLLILAVAVFLLAGCRQKKVDGIIIGSDLYSAQTVAENRKLCSIIQRTLKKDQQSLIELIDFPCGGGAGCYDLGYVLSQILYELGEREFMELIKGLAKQQKVEILGLIDVGLEYGDNNYDGKMDNLSIKEVFPILSRELF